MRSRKNKKKIRLIFQIITLLFILLLTALVLLATSTLSDRSKSSETPSQSKPTSLFGTLVANGISKEEARRRIAWSKYSDELYRRLEKTIPDEHGGKWFDTNDGLIKVGIPNSATKEKVEQIVAQLPIQIEYVPVKYTMKEIEQAYAAITNRPDLYDNANGNWQFIVGIIPSRNQVIISTPPKYIQLTEKQQSFIEDVIAEYGDLVGFDEYPGEPVDF